MARYQATLRPYRPSHYELRLTPIRQGAHTKPELDASTFEMPSKWPRQNLAVARRFSVSSALRDRVSGLRRPPGARDPGSGGAKRELSLGKDLTITDGALRPDSTHTRRHQGKGTGYFLMASRLTVRKESKARKPPSSFVDKETADSIEGQFLRRSGGRAKRQEVIDAAFCRTSPYSHSSE
jgi:hypothetical protein